jgi:dTDP-4-dehydrorhamnose 3,5-epimerase
MEVTPLRLDGAAIIKPRIFRDDRGLFYESYNADVFDRAGLNTHWQQDNFATSIKGTVRGLHFARGKGQIKLVRCTRGALWDVIVDIRPESPTLGQWEAVELSAENALMIYVPVGFAHGYCALTDEADGAYKCSEVYNPELESEILWNDPDVGIPWPADEPLISDRDSRAPTLRSYLKGLGVDWRRP